MPFVYGLKVWVIAPPFESFVNFVHEFNIGVERDKITRLFSIKLMSSKNR